MLGCLQEISTLSNSWLTKYKLGLVHNFISRKKILCDKNVALKTNIHITKL